MYMGPDFILEFRYSQLLSVVYVIMMYSTGIPLLYLVALVTFSIMYWVDKLLCKHPFPLFLILFTIVLKVYRLPPRYDMVLASQVRSLIKFSLLIHMLVGFVMLSNNNMFLAETS